MVTMISCVPNLLHGVDQTQVDKGLPSAEEQPHASNDDGHADVCVALQASFIGLKPRDDGDPKAADEQCAESDTSATKGDSEDVMPSGDGGDGELCIASPLVPAPALRDWRDGLVECGKLAPEYQVHFCSHFVQMGWCPAQQHCFHAHSVQERRTEAAVRLGVVGPSFKTRLCRSFVKTGECPRGKFGCRYAHGPAELRQEAAVSSGHLPLHYCTSLCDDILPKRGACLAPGCMKAHFPAEVRAYRKYAIPGVTYLTSPPAAAIAAPASSSPPLSRSHSPSPPCTPPPEQELRGRGAPVAQKEAMAGGSSAFSLPEHLYEDDVTSLQCNATALPGTDRDETEQTHHGIQTADVGLSKSTTMHIEPMSPAMLPLGLGAGNDTTIVPTVIRQPMMLSPQLALGHVYPHQHGVPTAPHFFPPQMPHMLFHPPVSISYAHSPLHASPVPYFTQPPMMAMPSMRTSTFVHSTTPK